MRIFKYKSSRPISQIYFIGLLLIVCFNGIISNLLPTVNGLRLGTLILDGCLLLGILVATSNLLHYGRLEVGKLTLILCFTFISSLVLLKAGLDQNSIAQRFLGWRNYFAYSLPLIILPMMLKKQHSWLRIISLILVVICAFAISQYIFREVYPEILLKLKAEDNKFNFSGYDFIRVNGLIGNPIVFTGFSVIASLLTFNIFIKTKNIWYLIGFLICFLSMWLTFSRAAWVTGTLIIAFNYFVITKLEIRRLLLVFALISVAFFSAYSVLLSNKDTFIYKRLFSQDESTRGSDSVHIAQIDQAFKTILEKPILGESLGSQGSSANIQEVIITDGWILQMALELGVPLASLVIIFILVVNFYALYHMRLSIPDIDILASTCTSAMLYFLLTGILNSSFMGKTVYSLYFILLGVLVSLVFEYRRRNKL